MTDNTEQRVDGHDIEIAEIKQTLSSHAAMIGELKESEKEILAVLGEAATKDDIISVNKNIDQSVNGLLRDAINAMPAKVANWWLAVAALCGVGGLILSLIPHHG